jgi:hypothetical protein
VLCAGDEAANVYIKLANCQLKVWRSSAWMMRSFRGSGLQIYWIREDSREFSRPVEKVL